MCEGVDLLIMIILAAVGGFIIGVTVSKSTFSKKVYVVEHRGGIIHVASTKEAANATNGGVDFEGTITEWNVS